MAGDEKIVEELNEKIGEAQEANSFFITVSYRIENRLFHFQAAIDFKVDDCILSLNECEKLVREANPKTPINIARFRPRTHK